MVDSLASIVTFQGTHVVLDLQHCDEIVFNGVMIININDEHRTKQQNEKFQQFPDGFAMQS